MGNRYTDLMDNRYGDLDIGSETFEEELLAIVQSFRPFSESLNGFLSENGYSGNMDDSESKARYIKERFRQSEMLPPREILLWFTENQPILRDTAFQLCFAFELNLKQTEAFFRKVFARERCFDCHAPAEAVYYWCIKNGKKWGTVQSILAALPKIQHGKIDADDVLYTGTILRELDQLTSPEQLISYLSENQNRFSYNNVTATTAIQRLWKGITDKDGLLIKEHRKFGTDLSKLPSGDSIRVWDAYLAIMGIKKETAKELSQDRSLKAVIAQLPKAVADAFPGRQSIEKIMRGQHVDYEVVRKCMILLSFYDYWCSLALQKGNYFADVEDEERCHAQIDQHLTDAGYMELYPGNPYDWVFLYSCNEGEPLQAFRCIWRALTDSYLADASEKPN